MPEWSKGDDLRSSVFVLVGSNPTQFKILFKLVGIKFLYNIIICFKLKVQQMSWSESKCNSECKENWEFVYMNDSFEEWI